MRSFKPFNSVSSKHCTHFDIRLESDFIVFRGDEHEAAGQLLKGVVVLCLASPLKIDNVHLKLTGTSHYAWTDARVTATGISSQKLDKTSVFYEHRWRPFVGVGSHSDDDGAGTMMRSVTLGPGNYEWPFEIMLRGDTIESVEGMREASIVYKLKATIARGKLAYDIHTYRRLRVIRTLEASALEFLHAMSVENIWPNKIEYSIMVPQKAVVFGSCIPLEMRFTPLLKGLELGDISVRLIEVTDLVFQAGNIFREHKKERQVEAWTLAMSRDEHWHDMIDDTGQEGWVMHKSLNLPKTLSKCLQDVNVKGIKIRHKLKLVVTLKNPDGHISELRATLPVTVFISPNMPLDENGNLVRQLPNGVTVESASAIAPPGYGEHVLDQLYQGMEQSGLQTPGVQSGATTPFYNHSRSGSHDNLAALSSVVSADMLSSRLLSMSLEEQHRNTSSNSLAASVATRWSSRPPSPEHPDNAPQNSSDRLRRLPSDELSSGQRSPPEHIDFPELCKVPSYQTAIKTPIKPLVSAAGEVLPNYQSVMSAPGSPELVPLAPPVEQLDAVPEAPQRTTAEREANPSASPRRPTQLRRRQLSLGFSFPHAFHLSHTPGDSDERRRLHLLQARERVA